MCLFRKTLALPSLYLSASLRPDSSPIGGSAVRLEWALASWMDPPSASGSPRGSFPFDCSHHVERGTHAIVRVLSGKRCSYLVEEGRRLSTDGTNRVQSRGRGACHRQRAPALSSGRKRILPARLFLLDSMSVECWLTRSLRPDGSNGYGQHPATQKGRGNWDRAGRTDIFLKTDEEGYLPDYLAEEH